MSSEDPYERADRVNEFVYIQEDFEAEIKLDSYYAKMPDFDKPDEDLRYISFKVIPAIEHVMEQIEGYTFCQYEIKEGNAIVSRNFWTNPHLAIGQYLLALEQHNKNPEAILRNLADQSEILATPYRKWRADLNVADRKKIFNSLTNEMIDKFEDDRVDPTSPQWQKALRTGEWRSKNLTQNAKKRVLNAIDQIEDRDGRSCYYTTLQVYRELWDCDDVEYCEGIALSEHTGLPTEHAWIEIDGEVAEVTWPHHQPDGGNAIYYGTSIPQRSVERRITKRGNKTTMLLDSKEYRQRKKLILQAMEVSEISENQ